MPQINEYIQTATEDTLNAPLKTKTLPISKKEALAQVARWSMELNGKLSEQRSKLSDEEFTEWTNKHWAETPFDAAEHQIEFLWSELDLCDTLGKRVRAIRRYYMMTQGEFSELLGVKQSSISRWEKDKAEPTAETLEKLAALTESDPVTILFGKREPTSAGELIAEVPVQAIGQLESDGSISFYKKNELKPTIDRPREGRPHQDVVGVFIFLDALFGPIQYEGWIFFYRSEAKFDPEHCLRQLCVVKLPDDPKLYLRTILPSGHEQEPYLLLSPAGGISGRCEVEWASPVLSMRQDGYSE